MIKILNSLLNIVITVINLVIDVFVAIITIFTSIPEYIDFLSSSVSVLPAFLLPYILFGIFLTVVAMLIRRQVF